MFGSLVWLVSWAFGQLVSWSVGQFVSWWIGWWLGGLVGGLVGGFDGGLAKLVSFGQLASWLKQTE